jgi:hypothetical protein
MQSLAVNYLTPFAMIGIFKTNIATKEDRQNVLQAIRNRFEVGHCHVDLEDCDKVLRITEMKVQEDDMIAFVKKQGFDCDVLE